MSKPTVFAVVTAQIQVAVRPSGSDEKLCDLMRVAQEEAEAIIRNKLAGELSLELVQGSVIFSHAIVKDLTKR